MTALKSDHQPAEGSTGEDVIPRHTRTMILLGGWLLMTAPWVKDQATPSGYRLRLDAPISEWVQDSAHDTAKSCEAMKANEFQESLDHSKAAFEERRNKGDYAGLDTGLDLVYTSGHDVEGLGRSLPH